MTWGGAGSEHPLTFLRSLTPSGESRTVSDVLSDGDLSAVARTILAEIGLSVTQPSRIATGRFNRVVVYDEIAVVVRVSDPAVSDEVRRGYAVAEALGTVGLGPRVITEVGGHVIAVLPRGEPLGVTPAAWTTTQHLAAHVHELDPGSTRGTLEDYDATLLVDRGLSTLRGTLFDSWVRPLSARSARIRATLHRNRGPMVVLHGDLHPRQVMITAAGPRLGDLDFVRLGELEADWGALVAGEYMGALVAGVVAETIATGREHPRPDRLALYGEAHVLRSVVSLATRYLRGETGIREDLLGAARGAELPGIHSITCSRP